MSAAAEDAPNPRGLPGPLPEGESILWQGAPSPAALARHALQGRLIALYFAAAAIFVAGVSWSAGRPLAQTAVSLGVMAAACGLVLGLIWLYAVLVARTTVYTITTRRIVMRVGVALPVTFNLPLAVVEGAGLRTDSNGVGDIPIAFGGTGRIGYVHLWPHARPWRVARPEPMLRGVPDAAQVAAILARALGGGPLGRAAAAKVEHAPVSTEAGTLAATALPSAAA